MSDFRSMLTRAAHVVAGCVHEFAGRPIRFVDDATLPAAFHAAGTLAYTADSLAGLIFGDQHKAALCAVFNEATFRRSFSPANMEHAVTAVALHEAGHWYDHGCAHCAIVTAENQRVHHSLDWIRAAMILAHRAVRNGAAVCAEVVLHGADPMARNARAYFDAMAGEGRCKDIRQTLLSDPPAALLKLFAADLRVEHEKRRAAEERVDEVRRSGADLLDWGGRATPRLRVAPVHAITTLPMLDDLRRW